MNNTKGKERRDNKSRRLCLLHKKDKEYLSKFAVVPHAGTWIEIQFSIQYDLENSSFPTRERGLKLKKQRAIKTVCGRSPRGNVDWNDVISMSCNILHGRSPRGNVDWNMTEIAFCKRYLCRSPRGNVDWNCVYMLINCPNSVVPHAGTWIEITAWHSETSSIPSFPTRERGLKSSFCWHRCLVCSRSPRGNVDWNLSPTWLLLLVSWSFPTRERGLKLQERKWAYSPSPSFPTRERGLKYPVSVWLFRSCDVVPHAGTWIEMVVRRFEGCCTCRSPHGNADWNNKEEIKRCGIWGVLYAEQNRKNRKSQLILAFNRHWCYNERN